MRKLLHILEGLTLRRKLVLGFGSVMLLTLALGVQGLLTQQRSTATSSACRPWKCWACPARRKRRFTLFGFA